MNTKKFKTIVVLAVIPLILLTTLFWYYRIDRVADCGTNGWVKTGRTRWLQTAQGEKEQEEELYHYKGYDDNLDRCYDFPSISGRTRWVDTDKTRKRHDVSYYWYDTGETRHVDSVVQKQQAYCYEGSLTIEEWPNIYALKPGTHHVNPCSRGIFPTNPDWYRWVEAHASLGGE